MRILSYLRIGHKIMLAPMLVLLLLLLLAFVSITGLNRQQAVVDDFYHTRFNQMKQVAHVSGLVQRSYSLTFELLASASANYPEAQRNEIERRIVAHISEGEAMTSNWLKDESLASDERKLVEELAEKWSVFRKRIVEVLEVARVDYGTAVPIMNLAQKDYERLVDPVIRLSKLEEDLSKSSFELAAGNLIQAKSLQVSLVVASFIAAIVLSWLIQRATVKSIGNIRLAANQLKSGDLRHRVPTCGRDEIAETAHAFNDLIDSFCRTLKAVGREAEQVAASSSELANDAAGVRDRSTLQSETLLTVAAAMQQLSVSVSTISDGAGNVRDAARTSLSNAENGALAVARLQDEIRQVRQAFEATSALIKRFMDSTASISGLTRQVRDIADQTNLLALNAAIEAARAGEAGRGFAVVADGVRGLAEQSASAAQSIDRVTHALAEQTIAVEQGLQRGHQALNSSTEHAEHLETVVLRSREAFTLSSRGIEEIVLAVGEQSAASQEISRNLECVSQANQENLEAVRHTADGTALMAGYASNLQVAVGQFRV